MGTDNAAAHRARTIVLFIFIMIPLLSWMG